MLDRMISADARTTIADVRDLLGAIRDDLDILVRQSAPTPIEPDAVPQRFVLSSRNPPSLGGSLGWVTPALCRVAEIWVGGDTAGRGVFQIGDSDATLGIPIWTISQQTQPYYFDRNWVDLPPGIRVVWNPPSGTTNWDCLIVYYLRQPKGLRGK